MAGQPALIPEAESMLLRRRHGLAFAALVCGGLQAAAPRWPAIDGDFSGVLRLDALGHAAPLAWHTHLQTTAEGPPIVDLEVTSHGLALHAHLTLPTSDAPGTWRLSEGMIELETWLPVALARAGGAALPPDLAATGAVRVAGEGTWRDTDVSGRVTVAMENATAGSTAQNWSGTGLAIAAELVLAKNLPTVHALRIGGETMRAAGLTLRRIAIEAAGDPGGRLEVRRAEVEMLGGRVALAPFTFDPAAPSIDTTAEFIGVGLGEIATLAPQALAEAHGELGGRVAVRWSGPAGAEPGAGTLQVGTGTLATVRLAAKPGFLTQSVPVRFNLIGESLGSLSRLLSLENPAYDTLRRIELGELPLVVDALEVKLYPDGPDGAVSARVELSGHPAEANSAVGVVSFSVNVAGPLSQVLQLGLQKNASMSVSSGR